MDMIYDKESKDKTDKPVSIQQECARNISGSISPPSISKSFSFPFHKTTAPMKKSSSSPFSLLSASPSAYSALTPSFSKAPFQRVRSEEKKQSTARTHDYRVSLLHDALAVFSIEPLRKLCTFIVEHGALASEVDLEEVAPLLVVAEEMIQLGSIDLLHYFVISGVHFSPPYRAYVIDTLPVELRDSTLKIIDTACEQFLNGWSAVDESGADQSGDPSAKTDKTPPKFSDVRYRSLREFVYDLRAQLLERCNFRKEDDASGASTVDTASSATSTPISSSK